MKRFSPERNVLNFCKSKVASKETTKFEKRKTKQKRTSVTESRRLPDNR
jgi:hypothetical protein